MKKLHSTKGFRLSDLKVIEGGLGENLSHCEKLFADAGLKPAEIQTLYASAGRGIIQRLSAARLELHKRGILALPGQSAPAAAAAAAAVNGEDVEAPAELVARIEALSSQIAELVHGRPGASAVTGRAEKLRAEIKSLAGALDTPSIRRKMQALSDLQALAAGNDLAADRAKADTLRAELKTLGNDSAGARRKTEICRELRQLKNFTMPVKTKLIKA